MKNAFVIILALLASVSFGQITYQTTYPIANGTFSMVKFHDIGYKYVRKDFLNYNFKIYNLNHTLYKTINIPSQALALKSVDYLSQRLFDNDSLIEYALLTGNGPYYFQFKIYKENGTLVMFRDSACYGGTGLGATSGIQNVFNIQEPVFFDGISTKLKLTILSGLGGFGRDEIYSLPGTIPCITCSSGLITGLSTNGENPVIEPPQFFPNPVSDQLKLKYKLPEGTHLAEMKIYNTEGKLVDEFKVTDDFDFIYLPTNYNNGLYLYSLIVDGKVVKTEKIVLNK